MQIEKNKNGFISIVAAVVTVAVIGGGIFMGSAAINNVAKSGCGDSVERWRSGQSYADIADNKEGAIEEAQKCQEAVNKATEVAKANAALLGRASNISGSGAELISTEAVNIVMDYVEESSKGNYKPLEENKRPPSDVREKIKEKEEKRKEEKKQEESRNNEDSFIEKESKAEESGCKLDVLTDGTPKVLASCEDGSTGFWYSDKDGDIVKLRVKYRINVPDLGGHQELEWQEASYRVKGDPICGFEPTENDHPDSPFGGYKSYIYVDVQIVDSKGNFSNISSCQIK
jgi:hypothetical protein